MEKTHFLQAQNIIYVPFVKLFCVQSSIISLAYKLRRKYLAAKNYQYLLNICCTFNRQLLRFIFGVRVCATWWLCVVGGLVWCWGIC